MVIFDSNIWIGYFYNEDPHHRLSQGLFSKQKLEEIIVTEYIVLEVTTILKQRKGFSLANTFLEFIEEFDISVLPSGEFYSGTKDLFQSLKEKHLSFVDVSLLYLSKKYTIETLDKHLKKLLK
ncbi:MAG: PIN domain-containing protein [Candidatus Moraniibacteriota bacterium]